MCPRGRWPSFVGLARFIRLFVKQFLKHDSPNSPDRALQNASAWWGNMNDTDNSERRTSETLAIALKDDAPGGDAPPRIVATGRGSVADQILAVAQANGVKIREDADLAQILSVLEVESIVPIEVLATISEILAYVYRSNAALLTEQETS